MVDSTIQLHNAPGDTAEQQFHHRQNLVRQGWDDVALDSLLQTRLDIDQVSTKNCENMIGSVEVPVGLAGPSTVQLDNQTMELWIPLATTEGALVASVSRGMKLLSQAGTTTVITQKKGMSRAPVFECTNGKIAQEFAAWLDTQTQFFAQQARESSSHLTYLNHTAFIQGRSVFVRFHFDTSEAMGMNMITIALEKIIGKLFSTFSGVKLLSISGNVCTDKKPAHINTIFGRGWWVQAESFIPKELIERSLHSDVETILKVHTQKNLVGGHIAGSLGQNAHIANVAAAFYLATGQDLAHTVNASLGSTTIESTADGIYCAVTLPEVDVGSVGGGTVLQPQSQARQLICQDKNVAVNSQLLAVTLSVGCLAAELSLLGALAAKHLGRAHNQLGRGIK